MIVMFSARRLKPGAWEQFRRAWDPGDSRPPGFQRAYHARNIRDEDEIISFGLFDMSKDDYHSWRRSADAELHAELRFVGAADWPADGVIGVEHLKEKSVSIHFTAQLTRLGTPPNPALQRTRPAATASGMLGSLSAGRSAELWR